MSPTPPPVETLDDIITRDDLAAFFGVRPGVLTDYIYGEPPLPFIKFKNRRYFSKRQVAWWLNQMQGTPDQTRLAVRKARRTLGRST